MSDFPETTRPTEASLNEAVPPAEPGDPQLDACADPQEVPAASVAPAMAEIDREVSEEMASIVAGDLPDPCGDRLAQDWDLAPAESAAPGTELTGTVVGLSDDDVFIEFDPKSSGVLPRSQFGKKELVEVGRRVDVVVERFDSDAGLLIVSRKGALQRATWINLSVGMMVEGRVTGVIKGGLEVDLKGIRAFMPASQVDTSPIKDISLLLNEMVHCEVIEFDRRDKNVLVSRRKAIERETAEAREKLKAELEVGQVRRGTVKNITDFGAFVDLGGIEGLAHIRDLSWATIGKVSDVLSPGQEVEVKVLKIDAKRGRISLGLKQTLPDPWTDVPERYPLGTTLKVRIVRNADFGAFAELEPGVEGLVPLSEMAWTRVNRSTEAVSEGDMVDAVVIRLEPEKRRLALSIKQAQPDPWDGVLEGYSEQSLTNGRVTRLTAFGAFVELVPGVEGLIHISELADRRVKSCSEVLQVGQEVEARVLGVDKENRRISLSIKQVNAPTKAGEAALSASSQPPKLQKKRKKPLRGGLASHFEW